MMLYPAPTMTRIATRLAREEDIPELQTIIRQSVTGLLHNDYTDRQIESGLIHLFGVDEQLIQDQTYYVAEVDGHIAGSGGWSFHNELYGTHSQGAEYLNTNEDAARIRTMFVHPEFARQGISSELLRVSEAAAKSCGFHQAELIATLTGVPFYTAKGYAPIKTVEVFLPDGVSLVGLQMSKALN